MTHGLPTPESTMRITLDYYHELNSAMAGMCLDCHEERECTEPDAQGRPCDECGGDRVMGCDWFLERDLVDDPDDGDEPDVDDGGGMPGLHYPGPGRGSAR